jgi:hypothetical protein
MRGDSDDLIDKPRSGVAVCCTVDSLLDAVHEKYATVHMSTTHALGALNACRAGPALIESFQDADD